MPKNTFPAEELSNSDAGGIVADLRGLYALGHVRGDMADDALFRERVQLYFDYCGERELRPGIEGLCLCLGITRQTLWNWKTGTGCTQRRQADVQQAYQLLSAALEQMGLSGKISPPSFIWLQKNWCQYTDTIRVEADVDTSENHVPAERIAEIRARYADAEKPRLSDYNIDD